ncbi:MAG: DUF6103 family protein [bacterium]
MKMSTVQIRYDSEKLSVLREYMNEAELHTGLKALLQNLYEKQVPPEVRETIDRQGQIVTV